MSLKLQKELEWKWFTLAQSIVIDVSYVCAYLRTMVMRKISCYVLMHKYQSYVLCTTYMCAINIKIRFLAEHYLILSECM